MTNFYLKRQGARIRDNRFKRSSCAHLFLGKKKGTSPVSSLFFTLLMHQRKRPQTIILPFKSRHLEMT